jgi:hypothetical protein
LIAVVFSLVTLTPHVLSILAVIYILSAPVAVLTKKARRRPAEPAPSQGDFDADEDPGP